MKTAAIPAVRVSPELRRAAEAVLETGETLSGFVEDAVRRNVEFRYAQKAFIERGLASGASARKSGKYISAAAVLGKLTRRLDKARKGCKTAALAGSRGPIGRWGCDRQRLPPDADSGAFGATMTLLRRRHDEIQGPLHA